MFMIRQIAFTICLISLIIFLSCNKQEDCQVIDIDQLFQFQEGDIFCLGTDIEIQIKTVDDQRCPCDVVCVWEGEFVYELIITSNSEEEKYSLNEKIENEATILTGLTFSDIRLVSDDSCEDPIDLEEMVFEMLITQ